VAAVVNEAIDVAPARRSQPSFVRIFRRSRLGMTGAVLFACVVVMALGAPLLAPQNPMALDPSVRLRPPGASHWLGTDDLGRDVFSRVVYGSRVSLDVGVLVMLFTTLVGIIAGVAAGFFRGVDNVIMRLVDVFLAIPSLLLAIALLAALGPRLSNIVVALTAAYVPRMVRVVRSQVILTREMIFVEAARSLGATAGRVAWLHVLPNSFAAVIVQGTFTFADAVLTEAGLSYLGVGEPPGVPSWGNMLADGRDFITKAPWIMVFPALAILVCVLGLNLLGDGLRDVSDPRSREF
jgi:peptide/nickel transport system permease protein